MEDEDEKRFEEKFKRWPSFFNLEVACLQTDRHIADNIGTLVRKLDSGEVECAMEHIKINNVLSFLYWKQGKKDEAKKCLLSVVSQDKTNINARCSQIWMDWKSGRKTAAKEALEKLCQVEESSVEFQEHHIRAKAEIAFYYSVSGPTNFHHSIRLYDEVLSERKGAEADVWKFERAIVLRKICNDENITQSKEYRELKYEECMKKAAHELYMLTSSGIGKRKIAICWASLGELLVIFQRRQRPSMKQSDIFPVELAKTKSETLLENALREYEDDTHVLKVCGKIFRGLNKLDRAEYCLTRSLELRETSYAYHHLALVMIEKIKNQGKEQETSFPDGEGATKLHNVATRHVYQIPENDQILAEKIINYLKRATEMNSNEWASFELGMWYRSLSQPDKAFDTFLETLHLRKVPSLRMEISCSEQQGFCCLDMAKAEDNAEKARQYDEDAKCFFQKAIRLAAYNASQLKHWKEECVAFPTLKEMFEAKEKNVNTLRELSELNKMLGEYGEALKFYDEIVKMDPDQTNNPLFIGEKARTYLEAKLYEDAATLLDLQSCTEKENLIPQALYVDVYFKCAFYCIETERPPNEFRKRLQQAFYASKKVNDSKYNFKFDIFLLHDEETVSDGLKERFIQTFTNYLAPSEDNASSFKITINSENVRPGTIARSEQIKLMEGSAFIIVIMQEEDTQRSKFKQYLQIAQDIDQDKSNRATLSIILLGDLIYSRELKSYPTIAFKKEVFDNKDVEANFLQWLKEFLLQLLVANCS